MLKYAGYDALVVTGAAPNPQSPVMIVINDDEVKEGITGSGTVCWGTNISEATHAIQKDLGHDWQSLVIGPPGEQQRNVAGIFNETRALARGGVGAVMGTQTAQSHRRAGHGFRAGPRQTRLRTRFAACVPRGAHVEQNHDALPRGHGEHIGDHRRDGRAADAQFSERAV